MRNLILLLALLAAGKVGLQEYLYRDAARDVIITAYRPRAIEACFRQAQTQVPATSEAQWTKPAAVTLAIGKTSLSVYIWQIDHPQWQARYRNPYLFITPAGRDETTVCEYDIVNGLANLQKL